MDLKEFTAAMACAVQKEISREAVVRPQTVSKNNGVVLQGLLFQKEGCKNAPTIYLEPYYQAFREGEDFANLAQQVAACYKKYALIQDFQADFFLHYEDVRETIAYKLVNYGKNRKLLADVPHLPYLDLAMVFYSLIHHPEIGAATILIHGSHLNMWKATHRMLYEDAKRNTPRLLEASLIPMQGILYGNAQGQTEKFPPIYVLTNKERMNGAASLLYEGMLEQCAQACKGPFFLLPSSIHEVILAPYQAGAEAENLRGIVREVNSTQLDPQEILSDSVYFYSTEKKKLLVL